MKKTFEISREKFIEYWDMLAVEYFNYIDPTYFDYTLDHVIDLLF